ncbi:MAG TPA: putative porin [Pyrinomonadaceae bacterium]|nr:putative porin [Pyrinomonadaceae bacterium]
MIHFARRAPLACALFAALAACAFAQTPAATPVSGAKIFAARTTPDKGDAALDDVRQQLREQRAEIEQLRAALAEQTRLLNELLARTGSNDSASRAETGANAGDGGATVKEAVNSTGDLAAVAGALRRDATTATGQTATKNPQSEPIEARVRAIETQAQKASETLARQLGSITFSGDLRLRFEGQFGQLNALPNAANPAILGNELSARHRMRLRARLALRGLIGKEFDWGLRFATGTLTDVASSNQTLTDFFNRKEFALDQAYLTYRPSAIPGLRLQGGKFETPWLFTEMTFDADIQPEGINESYTRDFNHGTLKNLTLVAWQLPMLERQAAFVLGADGRVNVDASRRGGRDLALYGAQARTRLALGAKTSLTLSAADLYFSGTQFITPAQVFGGQLQVPVTVTIPATATTPAQTVTGFAAVPRDALVAGGGVGASAASTNAVNRDGRLASGFNLVDLIARLELTHSKRFPVTLLFNFVTNTQTRDVVAAGAGGANRLIPNHESNGYWAQIQAGKTRERGDLLFNYTFVRIERDAVLTPFNFSDIVQPSDVRAHRMLFTYTADPRVLLTVTGIVSQRPNGLAGAFGTTPAGSLNRPTTRFQFDTIFRF